MLNFIDENLYQIPFKKIYYFSATQSRMIQDRIAKVETHFGDLCSSIAAYGRKESRVRDKGKATVLSRVLDFVLLAMVVFISHIFVVCIY